MVVVVAAVAAVAAVVVAEFVADKMFHSHPWHVRPSRLTADDARNMVAAAAARREKVRLLLVHPTNTLLVHY